MSNHTACPRPEYPRPQFRREDWLNLNGLWTCEFDFGKSGMDRKLFESKGFSTAINVPFCPESKLSEIGHTDFIDQMWYHRKLEIPAHWGGRLVLLHFGAVDFECEVFVDGQSAIRHWGGSSSFTADITRLVKPGAAHELVVHVVDDPRSSVQTCGKQSNRHESYGCKYTRVTGIWQTVWLEACSPFALESMRTVADLDGERFVFTPRFHAIKQGCTLTATVKDGKEIVAENSVSVLDEVPCEVRIHNPKTWSPESPFLYELLFEVKDANGKTLDAVQSYAGMRKVHVEGDKIFLNNQEIFLRLVLDQGYYAEGIWTAPSDEALKRDIELSMNAGFNGARLHQKVFEERFHYWADKLGYLTWGESASWGLGIWRDGSEGDSGPYSGLAAWNFLDEWREIIVRDRNHPSIIAWTPFNETRGMTDERLHHRLHVAAYELTRTLDPTRPVNDASGYIHVKTDLYTVHNYKQSPEDLATELTPEVAGEVWRNIPDKDAPYEGQPYLVDEMGGIKWIPREQQQWAENSWGYGDAPKTEEEFYARLEGLVDVLLNLPHMRGYCYTQLTDVEQEQNGIYNYDRTPKLDMERIAAIFHRLPPARG
jgi:beta-galactosidase/beta-glucuronidase